MCGADRERAARGCVSILGGLGYDDTATATTRRPLPNPAYESMHSTSVDDVDGVARDAAGDASQDEQAGAGASESGSIGSGMDTTSSMGRVKSAKSADFARSDTRALMAVNGSVVLVKNVFVVAMHRFRCFS